MRGVVRRTVITLVFALGMVGVTGCRRTPVERTAAPLETEVVGGAVDKAMTTAYDVQARSSQEAVGSQLPGDFPRDLPLYGSSSVINYGLADSERRFVELSVPAQQAAVERRYDAQIEAAGWRRAEGGTFVRGERMVVVTYREGTPGTWVRIEYPLPS